MLPAIGDGISVLSSVAGRPENRIAHPDPRIGEETEADAHRNEPATWRFAAGALVPTPTYPTGETNSPRFVLPPNTPTLPAWIVSSAEPVESGVPPLAWIRASYGAEEVTMPLRSEHESATDAFGTRPDVLVDRNTELWLVVEETSSPREEQTSRSARGVAVPIPTPPAVQTRTWFSTPEANVASDPDCWPNSATFPGAGRETPFVESPRRSVSAIAVPPTWSR